MWAFASISLICDVASDVSHGYELNRVTEYMISRISTASFSELRPSTYLAPPNENDNHSTDSNHGPFLLGKGRVIRLLLLLTLLLLFLLLQL
jgi:hypothetical protein